MDHEVHDLQEFSDGLPGSSGLEMVITVRSVQSEDNEGEEEERDVFSEVYVEPVREECVVEVADNRDYSSGWRDGEDEKLCRICCSGSPDLIQLGCRCKDDLGMVHRHCAEAWFEIKGSMRCEICRKTAKNISRSQMNGNIFVFVIYVLMVWTLTCVLNFHYGDD